jgi:hypothetical protein
MNPFVASLISAGVRWLLTLAAAHEITVSQDDTTRLISGAVALATLMWSWAHKAKVDAKITSLRGY